MVATMTGEPFADTTAGLSPECRRTRARFVLYLDDGQAFTPDLPAVLGRCPAGAVQPGDTALTVPDPTHSVSEVHCRISPADYGLWVEDLGSTYGTLVHLESGRTISVQPRTPIFAGIGTRIQLGNRMLLIGV